VIHTRTHINRSQVPGQPLPAVAVTDVAVSSAPVAATPNKTEPSGTGKYTYLHEQIMHFIVVAHAVKLVQCAFRHERNTYCVIQMYAICIYCTVQ
jgi:hypothetical protein